MPNQDGSVNSHRDRLVSRGFQPEEEAEVYAPVIDLTTVQVAAVMSLVRGYTIHQVDDSNDFLNGRLSKEHCICILPPLGIVLKVPRGQVLKLNLALYDLKNAPRIWNDTLNNAAKKLGFERRRSDECVYFYGLGDSNVYLFIYMDEIIVVGREHDVLKTKRVSIKLYSMRDLGKCMTFSESN